MSWDDLVNRFCCWLCRTFPSRHRVIPRGDLPGTDMLDQFMIIPNHLYLQHFRGAESKAWFHHHRWKYMRSFVLSAQYVEEFPWRGMHVRGRGETHTMNNTTIHRVQSWHPKCWTLFWVWNDLGHWGYYSRDLRNYIPWQIFVQRRIPTIERKDYTK